MDNIYKTIFTALGGAAGWLIAAFRPTFPLMIVAICFMVYDAYTAFRLEKRVSAKYPDKARGEGKFNSDDFGKLLKSTIPSRLIVIILAFMVEKWVFTFIDIPLSYIVTGLICFEQAWSIMENESSCRSDDQVIFWRLLRKVMIDKTARHLNMDAEELQTAMSGEQSKKQVK